MLTIKSLLTRRHTYVLYDTCGVLTLDRFIRLICDGDLTSLIAIGKPGAQVLKEAHERISDEYSELTADKKSKALLNCVKQITYLTNKINQVKLLVHQMLVRPNPALIPLLRAYGFSYDYTDTLEDDLGYTLTELKADELELNELLSQYQDQTKGAKQATKGEFYDLIADMSAEQGYAIVPAQTTVVEYVAIYNRYKKQRSIK